MNKYKKIYDDFDEIMGNQEYFFGAPIKKELSQETIQKMKEYVSQKFSQELDAGEMRTILVFLKPYKNYYEELSSLFKFCVEKYEEKYKNPQNEK